MAENNNTFLDKPRLDNLTNEIWRSAERLRGKFKQYEYQKVVLPMIVLRRLECVLVDWREQKKADIRAKRPTIKDADLAKLVKNLEMNDRSLAFYNSTDWTLKKVYEDDSASLEKNFRAYIKGFSDKVQQIVDKFDYRNTIGLMAKYHRLAPIIGQYMNLALGPDALSPLEMGYVYEELLRRFSEQSGEEAGEHFTPREVIRLMVELLGIDVPKKHVSIYDPACGTGGMLSVAKEHLRNKAKTDAERSSVEKFVTVHGQELDPSNFAICLSDLLIKNDPQAKITFGNSLVPFEQEKGDESDDLGDRWQEPKWKFDFMLSNPPFGVTWGGKDGYEADVRKLAKTRYQAGIPRVNDGALLFLETMLAKMKPVKDGGSRIAVIFNGSPLSNGDCGSGESNIRSWVLEHDWLDAIVMLPDQLFYNTGIYTYIWILTNNKPKSHQGKVMVIDAREVYEKEPKSFGNKRNRITEAHRAWTIERYRDGWRAGYDDPKVKIFPTSAFAYHKVEVVFWQTDAEDRPLWKEEPFVRKFTATELKKDQTFYAPETLIYTVKFDDGTEDEFKVALKTDIAKELKKFLHEHAAVKSVVVEHPEYVEDSEYIPFEEDIETFLKREITTPLIRWAELPQLGYEILPNKYFYKYVPPVSTKELMNNFRSLEREADELLKGLDA